TTAVSLLTSSGGASSVTLGSFSAVNHLAASAYTSTGSPVAGLNDNALKLDWNGSTWGNWPTATLTLSGLPANAPVTVFGYGASFYNTYTLGSTWTLGAGNGGATASMGYYGPAVSADPAGMDLTLVENQGVSWIVIAGNADASGNLTVVMTPTSVAAPSGGSQAYWQTYLNGMQVEVAAVPEPGTLALVTLGFGGFLILRRR
ncbi:MAG TPA: PEP-CTERM sorting domain-containing protein, partial [Candidatus Paceibacterota bacterium]|nr:PEP-CTERM sorting domain-containing protein [Candidatus Paceibacterota bacterium]